MVTRRQGREWALQMIVQFDLNPPQSPDAAAAAFWIQQEELETEALAAEERNAQRVFTSDDPRIRALLAEMRAFAEERALGVWRDRDKLDSLLEEVLEHWSIYRLGTVERSVLRLGVWEMINHMEIPSPILINEHVDLAKFFSETKSGRFVNGILDKFARTRRDVAPPPEESQSFTPGES